MTEFFGKVDVRDDSGALSVVRLDGNKGEISIYDALNKLRIKIKLSKTNELGFDGGVHRVISEDNPNIQLINSEGEVTVELDSNGSLQLGGINKPGHLSLNNSLDEESILLNGTKGSITTNAVTTKSLITTEDSITLKDKSGRINIVLNPAAGERKQLSALYLGGESEGLIAVRDKTGKDSLLVDGAEHLLGMRNAEGSQSVNISGEKANIAMSSTGYAENFKTDPSVSIAPGTPVSLGDNGLITPAGFAESGRFLGIAAGTEGSQAGIVLDKDNENSIPVVMIGKVFCKVLASGRDLIPGDPLYVAYSRDFLTNKSSSGDRIAHADTVAIALGEVKRRREPNSVWDTEGFIPVVLMR